MTWDDVFLTLFFGLPMVFFLGALIRAEILAGAARTQNKKDWSKAASEYPAGMRIGDYRVVGHGTGRADHTNPVQRYSGVLVCLQETSPGSFHSLVYVPYPAMGGFVLLHDRRGEA